MPGYPVSLPNDPVTSHGNDDGQFHTELNRNWSRNMFMGLVI